VPPGIEKLAGKAALLRYFLSENHRSGVRHRIHYVNANLVPYPEAPPPPMTSQDPPPEDQTYGEDLDGLLPGAFAEGVQASSETGPFPPGHEVKSTATGDLLEKLKESPRLDEQRFELEGEVGKGGMGAILKIHDRLLNRRLAMKVLLERSAPRDDDERRLASQLTGRFLEEAQVTGQLDHPGVVPVHELGLDQNGKVWFTMRLVKGRTAREVFEAAFHERGEWNLTRALEVVLKVCDTMAYAHGKGVLHRDLKPANVMVGRFGEVYVMDWGLAKLAGQDDRHDLRIRERESSPTFEIASARRADADSDAASSVVTMDGHALGTPSYMPPEQARSEELDARADVYAIGAMMYELVAGRAPYTAPGVQVSPYRILQEVVDGPPKRIEAIKRNVPAELVAIIDKAMARASDDRFASVSDLAADIRAFLANRVVQAYRTGALVEMRLWMRRNKVLAAALMAVAVSMVAGIVATRWQAEEAGRQRSSAMYNLRRFDTVRYRALLEEARRAAELIPLDSARNLVAIERWLLQFAQIGEEGIVEEVEAAQQALEKTEITSYGPGGQDYDEWLDSLARLNARHGASPSDVPNVSIEVEAPDPAIEFLRGMVDETVRELEAFRAPETGLLARIEQARQHSIALRNATLDHPNAGATWEEARAAIARADGVTASELYAGRSIPLEEDDIWGLVPIGMNPRSKLWEFYDLRSAWDRESDPQALPVPEHDEQGRLKITGETGIVFVLLPGGSIQAVAEATQTTWVIDTDQEHRFGTPLSPYFLSKHEVTQGQWVRWTGDNPSVSRTMDDWSLPVEQVSWQACSDQLNRLGLKLPTRLQWEYAIRAGTTTTYWTGDSVEEILLAENILDIGRDGSIRETITNRGRELLPVGSLTPNGFGLFDMGGNVSEWTREPAYFGVEDVRQERPGDGDLGELDVPGAEYRTDRGGSFSSNEVLARSGAWSGSSGEPDWTKGLRPVRELTSP
jgi:serine/threonine protein kinase/formylglycine-generating enzyme required for sulfatase activity